MSETCETKNLDTGIGPARLWFHPDGRISRRVFVVNIVAVALAWLALSFGLSAIQVDVLSFVVETLFRLPLAIAAIWALLALCGKRWHDLGKGGGWNLTMLAIGPLMLVYLGLARGKPQDNRYGPVPQ